MKSSPDHSSADMATGTQYGQYRVLRNMALPNIEAEFIELAHGPTGARHIHIRRADKENTFGVAFKTVPRDSTGVAHILEHTVLCGSQKYPVRDPFFSMLKRSLATFMNAFTASDWTMYPFATQNRKDFYNLLGVYLDATFFPRLEELNFKQEGHRLEFDAGPGETEELVFKGVVFNEMKGAMSSPDQIMVRSLMNALYPDTTYRHNSGGDPAVIPDLTYEQLLEFHRRHYHPSNAFFYTYGDLDLRAHLDFIEQNVLRHFERIDPQTEVPSQTRWQTPREVSYHYPLGADEDPTQKYQAAVAWLMSDVRDSFEVLILTLLEQVLLGNPASPLRKALIDSQLGSALSDGTGFDADNRDTLFACGLKDVSRKSLEAVEKIVYDCLRHLADTGIATPLIEAAIHQIEFHRKEVTNTPYPYGLKLLMTFAGTWIHTGDPLRILRIDQDLDRLRNALKENGFIESRLRHWFIDNPHRVRFALVPDIDMAQDEKAREEAALFEIRNRLSFEEIDKIQRDTIQLKKLQEAEEDLSALPTLARTDIPVDIVTVTPSSVTPGKNTQCYDQPTSGIFYLSAAAAVDQLSTELIPLVPFFCHTLTKIGSRQNDYIELARRIDATTGGLGFSAHVRRHYGGKNRAALPFVALSAKCLDRNVDPMFDLVVELSQEALFNDRERLKNLLLEYRAGLEAMVIHNGHRLAISLASRNFTSGATLNDLWNGIHQLQTIKSISDDLSDAQLDRMTDRLGAIGETLFKANGFRAALVGSPATLPTGETRLMELISTADLNTTAELGPPPISAGSGPTVESWYTASAVSFVAQVFETVRMEHEDAPRLAVISKMLRSLYLHREIREKGGAYGGFALYNPEDGLFCMASYRDPHIISTLNAFEGAGKFIQTGRYSEEDVKEAVLQVCSDIDKPDPPGPAARKAFYRSLVGLDDQQRLEFKRRVLAVDVAGVTKTAERYFGANQSPKAVAVISNRERIETANEKLTSPLALHKI